MDFINNNFIENISELKNIESNIETLKPLFEPPAQNIIYSSL